MATCPEAEVMSVDLSQVLQALIEDRQTHERDLAEEHERREEEQRRKEVELQMEQKWREEETRQQVELLQKLVEGVLGNGGGGLESCSMCMRRTTDNGSDKLGESKEK